MQGQLLFDTIPKVHLLKRHGRTWMPVGGVSALMENIEFEPDFLIVLDPIKV